MIQTILGAIGAGIGLYGLMLLVPVLRGDGRPRPPEPAGGIRTSPYADQLADTQLADRAKGQQ